MYLMEKTNFFMIKFYDIEGIKIVDLVVSALLRL